VTPRSDPERATQMRKVLRLAGTPNRPVSWKHPLPKRQTVPRLWHTARDQERSHGLRAANELRSNSADGASGIGTAWGTRLSAGQSACQLAFRAAIGYHREVAARSVPSGVQMGHTGLKGPPFSSVFEFGAECPGPWSRSQACSRSRWRAAGKRMASSRFRRHLMCAPQVQQLGVGPNPACR
jgi:hypothetical protein